MWWPFLRAGRAFLNFEFVANKLFASKCFSLLDPLGQFSNSLLLIPPVGNGKMNIKVRDESVLNCFDSFLVAAGANVGQSFAEGRLPLLFGAGQDATGAADAGEKEEEDCDFHDES